MSNLVFFGTSEFAVLALDVLIKNGTSPVAAVTSPDRPAGRGKKLTVSPVKEFLNERLVLLQPEKLDSQLILKLKELSADMGVIASYGKILPKELIEIFPKGILNIHPSLLPKYRGASPIQAVILNGDAETGVSIILLDEKMDHGPVLAQSSNLGLGNLSCATYLSLHDSLAKLGAELLIETIPKWLNGEIIPHPQDDSQATFTKLIKKEDGKIDWTKSAEKIERTVRAFYPWPCAFTDTGGKRLKIVKAEIIENKNSLKPGTFFEHEKFPAIACGEKALNLLAVQPAGKKEMSGEAYLRGHRESLRGPTS
ncbi:MAG: Methionyl-tRNA formyltransferase [Candidatus Giovannonibacteria bacterium GW2011_GWA2_44_13b]|uniref:Methionyl-tRNA formyltransferase n=2 Tax=Candidatus Giovannoniibacteriota TaxID=1752738 RepID=A0A0G1K3C1_9BACT|nr:MAG: Methionyl-tRNA formyltransferase [Candidatus Giovannonibacteria bacterium GW2011_GWA2_44_13b]OGF83224.1 MAG: methionyl-tRNA formyltransferase [Candidatus Giovannonibacteria bacterium RIFCSPLOWO2_01_FULL_44_16]